MIAQKFVRRSGSARTNWRAIAPDSLAIIRGKGGRGGKKKLGMVQRGKEGMGGNERTRMCMEGREGKSLFLYKLGEL